jgi:predicted MFS family arabinose efflux permease
LGLLGYATGAIAMTVAQNLTTIIIFWAIIGGLGASLLLPAMQSLIHGNFSGPMRRKAYASVGAAAAIAAAVGPLLGGFITTYLSWRVGFLLEAVIIGVVLLNIGLVKEVPFIGNRAVDWLGAGLSVVGMGGVVLSILIWQEGGEAVVETLLVGLLALGGLAYWLVKRKRQQRTTLLDPGLFKAKPFRLGISEQMLQQISLGGMMIALPMYLQMVFEYNALEAGLSLAPLSLSMFGISILAGRRAGARRPGGIIRAGYLLLTLGTALLIILIPRAGSAWPLVVPLLLAGSGLGLLVSQLNNYTLSPIAEKSVSEAAGVNSAAGSFGLSFGLAFSGAIMLAMLSFSFTTLASESSVLSASDQEAVASALDTDAEIMSNTQIKQLTANQPLQVQAEIVRINTEARHDALQLALFIPLAAGAIGLINSFRMIRLPDPKPSPAIEPAALT